MKNNKGFVISTTLYSIFGIMLITVFYILYILSDNRLTQSSSINSIKEELEVKPVDSSGANPPILADGLIPVEYDDTNDVWVKANEESAWYNYGKQKWANAVTVTNTNRSTYMSAEAGTEISMDDINAMWVWIPRYMYKIPSDIGSSSTVEYPQEINVIFESDTSTIGVDGTESVVESTYRTGITDDGTNTNYYTHPAFRDGSAVYNTTPYDIGGFDKELTGFWVGKFETGGTANTPIIKPDITSIREQNVSTQFKTALKFAGGEMDDSTGVVTFSGNETYGLNSSVDTHMMKNTEWGAVAILSQSQYGKMGNSNYIPIHKEVYANNSVYTGRSGGYHWYYNTPDSLGLYAYNGAQCVGVGPSCGTNGSQYVFEGTGASTTGTIYGVYDMNGGAFEYTMGSWNKLSGWDLGSNSGFNGQTGTSGEKTNGISFPESKYYDLYQGGGKTFYITKESSILGDATWETMNWYDDRNDVEDIGANWATRGRAINVFSRSGVFGSYIYYGSADSDISFRSILIP